MTADAIIIPDICPDASVKPVKTHEEWIKAHVHPGNPKNGDKPHTFTPCRYMTKDSPMPNTSVVGIQDETYIHDPDNYEIRHKVEITPLMHVLFNGVNIAQAPGYKKGKSGKEILRTQAEKLRFCRAVVWALDNDEINLRDHIARFPAIAANQIQEDVPTVTAVPEVIPAIYPDIDLMPDLESKISADIQEMDPKSNCCDPYYEGYDRHDLDNMALVYDQSGNLQEMWAIINPIQVIRQWTYRGMQIREEVLSCFVTIVRT